MENGGKRLPSKANLILRGIAAVYLLYIAYGLKDSILHGEGTRQVVCLLFGILFLAAAALLLFFSVKRLLNGQYAEAAQAEDETRE